MEFFDRYFYIPPSETGTWSSLSPRNLPVKFGTNPSTIVFVIVVTERQTHTQTNTPINAGKNILPRFRGENNTKMKKYQHSIHKTTS